jgi:hypothetical protein
MTILEVARGVALKVGLTVPTVLYASTTRELVELGECLNDTAQMVAFDCGHDWTTLKTLATLTGDDVTLAFAKPSDYRRMLKKSRMWPTASPYSPLVHYTDTDQWLGLQVQDFQPVVGAWTMIGDSIEVRISGSTSPLASGDTVQFYYISTKYAASGAGTLKTSFTADDDTFRLNERLLKLATIYKWKDAKGQDYSEPLADYEAALAEQIGNDKGSRIIAVGQQRVPGGVEFAFPGTLGP